MASEANSNGGFRGRMEHYLYSGEKKHVFAGIAIISVIFGVPWYLLNRGSLLSSLLLDVDYSIYVLFYQPFYEHVQNLLKIMPFHFFNEILGFSCLDKFIC